MREQMFPAAWALWAIDQALGALSSSLDRLVIGRFDPGLGRFAEHKLRAGEFREVTAEAHEFIEAAGFDDATVLEDQDARGIADGGEPMRDHEGGAPFHHLNQR